MAFRNSPGCHGNCCGEGGCNSYDDMSWDAGSWDEVSGTWSYGSPYSGANTSDNYAQLIYTESTIAPTAYFYATILFGATFSSRSRFIFNWTDSSNFYFVEGISDYISGTSYNIEVRIGRTVSGSETILVSDSVTGQNVPSTAFVSICWQDGILIATLVVGASTVIFNIAHAMSIPTASYGVGTGDLAEGAGGEFYRPFWEIDINCGTCNDFIYCPDCTSDQAARQYSVEISNFVDDSCSDCELFNGTFTLFYHAECNWRSAVFTACGDDYYYELTISAFSISVNLKKASDHSYVVIWVEGTPDLDCLTYADYEVPLDVGSFGVAPTGCTNNDTGNALVTAL